MAKIGPGTQVEFKVAVGMRDTNGTYHCRVWDSIHKRVDASITFSGESFPEGYAKATIDPPNDLYTIRGTITGEMGLGPTGGWGVDVPGSGLVRVSKEFVDESVLTPSPAPAPAPVPASVKVDKK